MPDLVKIRFTALEQALGLPTPLVEGTISVVAWAGNEPLEAVDGETVTFAVGKCIPIADGQPEEEILLPPSGAWCYRWVITDTRTGQSLVRYTTVPNVDEVDFGDLPVVDPQTFEPTPDVVKGWNAALEQVRAELSDHETRIEALESGSSGVSSVNGLTGDVELTAGDVGALPDTYTPPVVSVNGETGEVSLAAGEIPSTDGTVQIDLDSLDLRVTDLEDNPTGAVSSVNGETGDVVLTSSDITTPSGTVQSDLDDLDTRVTDLENNPGGVSSVNGQTGDVTLTATDISATGETVQGAISRLDSTDDDLDARVTALEDAPDPGAPVTSVNGQTGDVVLDASDVGALPDSYTAPVASVNGKTGPVDLTAGDISSESGSVQGDLSSLAASVAANTSELANHESRIEDLESNPGGGVTSVNGLTGDVELAAAEIPYRTGLSSATALSRVLAEDVVPQLDDLMTAGRYAVGPDTLNLPGPILGGVVEVTVIPNYLDTYRVTVQSLKVIWGTTVSEPPAAGQGYQRSILTPLADPDAPPVVGSWIANETRLDQISAPAYRGITVGNGNRRTLRIATGIGTQHFSSTILFGSSTTGPATPTAFGFSIQSTRVARKPQIEVGSVAGYGSIQETAGPSLTPLLAVWGPTDAIGPSVLFHRMSGEPLVLGSGPLPTGGLFSYSLTHQYGQAT